MHAAVAAATVPISVAIPCYGHEVALATTLGHIFACDPLPQEVLLHFDGGWIPQRDFSACAPVPVRIFNSSQKIGPGGGRDLLFKEADCEIVCSFDDDSWPLDAFYFKRALELMNAFPDAAFASPAVYLREKPQMQCLSEVSESVYFEGSASITRRSHYLKLPGYVPVPDAYGVEEVDISLQAHAAGFEILNCPWIRAWHDRPHVDNEHSVLPWIRNEVLLAYLRYPCWLQPWGWIRAFRHVMMHAATVNLFTLIKQIALAPAHCVAYRRYLRRYTISAILSHHYRQMKRWTIQDGATGITLTQALCQGRILYVQYTNPGAYPPLQHSAIQLASCGWQVHLKGIHGRDGARMEFPPFPRISMSRMNWCAPGLRQKLHYLTFVLKCLLHALRFRPDWVYCSDPLSALPGNLINRVTGARLIYHEHDSPSNKGKRETRFSGMWWNQRAKTAKRAEIVILPNQARLDVFQQELPSLARTFCVWNCPSVHELHDDAQKLQNDDVLRILYHGSIVPERFPPLMLEALADSAKNLQLRLIGYEVPGMIGYTDKLKLEAKRLGIEDRFEYLGTLPQRSDLMARASECDVGLALLRFESDDINMRHMAGASNKPFDYLSQGLALIVPNDVEWEHLFVENGCAVACEPGNKAALVKVFHWLATNRDQVKAMGRRGLELVRTKWNYESQFAPVLEILEQSVAKRSMTRSTHE